MSVKGLIVNPKLSKALAVELKFEPSMGIMARRVDKLGLDIRSFREPLKRAIQKVMIPSFRRNFEEEGRPAWDDIVDTTRRRKEKAGYGDRGILRRSDSLFRTVQQLNIWTISTEAAYVKDLPEKVWYGKVHQQGATFTFGDGFEGGVPARPFIVAQDEDVDDIEEVFGDWLEERIARAGLAVGGRAKL